MASDDATNDAAGIHGWAHERQRVTHEFAAGGSPNNDTLTSWEIFDLRDEPVILEVPDMIGRYYSIQILDNYINNFAYIGRRTTGIKAGVYALIGRANYLKVLSALMLLHQMLVQLLGS